MDCHCRPWDVCAGSIIAQEAGGFVAGSHNSPLDNDVKMGSVSINDIRQGRREKIIQLLRALRAWEERRQAIAESVGRGAVAAGPFMGMAAPINYSII